MDYRHIKLTLISLVVSLFAVYGFHFLSQYEVGSSIKGGLLRVAFRYQDNKVKTCRAYTETELQTIPVHMRKTEFCELEYIAYVLSVDIDGVNKINKVLSTGGRGHDRPLITMNELKLDPGEHQLILHFKPLEQGDNPDLKSYTFEKNFELGQGQIAVLKFDGIRDFALSQEPSP